MSKLDDELAKAVAESEAQEPEPAPAYRTPAAPPPKKRKLHNLGLVIALIVMAGGILTLVLTSFNKAAVYSKTVDQLMAEKHKITGRSVRVAGTLVKGSLKRRDQPCEYRFSLTKNDVKVDVRYAQCVVPDTFRDVPGMDVEVTAEGKLTEEGYFEANQIMAKCPSKYEMKDKASKGEKAPHTEIAQEGVPPAGRAN